ncbi:hypothetical protein [Oceanispirochaeta sp. M1]|uniref:hypothetical protein n=1 Tax=Oceanispirochaeta sp. M1 TaxID=2283433 RepID=UPI000E09359E|nr:hypothetical protein [Oceanispirochaeta sp. M1]NPD75305.1 hypothetical protein [Oceanispirochaeta sp. M1]RDG28829.1 hypothetical protein DV872_24730 [Oceanispirochaeta sp. M1]
MAKTSAERQREYRDKLKKEGKRQMLVTITNDDWDLGFKAGKESAPSKAPSDADGMSWYSGYIEGKAARGKD